MGRGQDVIDDRLGELRIVDVAARRTVCLLAEHGLGSKSNGSAVHRIYVVNVDVDPPDPG